MSTADSPLAFSTAPHESRGIYLLGNDPIIDWLTALTSTLRRFEPTAPIVLIPFDSRLRQTRRLAAALDIELLEDPDLLSQLDEIGDRFHPENPVGARLYRKFAVFNGPFREFLYLDADVIVQAPIAELVRPIADGTVDFIATDREDAHAIFKGASPLSPDQPLVNAGIFASTRGALDFHRLPALLGVSGSFNSGEQSALNCLLAEAGLRVGFAGDLVEAFPHQTFASALRSMPGDAVEAAPLVHWAGEALSPSMSLRSIFRTARCSWKKPGDSLRFLLWTSRVRPWLRSVLRAVRSFRAPRRHSA